MNLKIRNQKIYINKLIYYDCFKLKNKKKYIKIKIYKKRIFLFLSIIFSFFWINKKLKYKRKLKYQKIKLIKDKKKKKILYKYNNWVYTLFKLISLNKGVKNLKKPKIFVDFKIQFNKKLKKLNFIKKQFLQKIKRFYFKFVFLNFELKRIFSNQRSYKNLFLHKIKILFRIIIAQEKKDYSFASLQKFFSAHRETNFIIKKTTTVSEMINSSSNQKTKPFFSRKIPFFLINYLI